MSAMAAVTPDADNFPSKPHQTVTFKFPKCAFGQNKVVQLPAFLVCSVAIPAPMMRQMMLYTATLV